MKSDTSGRIAWRIEEEEGEEGEEEGEGEILVVVWECETLSHRPGAFLATIQGFSA